MNGQQMYFQVVQTERSNKLINIEQEL